MAGKVYLVGAGPGDPELLTVKAIRCLQIADVVLYDRLVHPAVLEYASPTARCEYVGKEHGDDSDARQIAIIQRMVAEAKAGRIVVRLKGGDPFVFGRGGEEALALVEAGLEVEIVPGVSSAIAAPASAGIPLTFRGLARAFGVFTGATAGKPSAAEWPIAAALPAAVFLMPVHHLRCIAQALIQHGRNPQTPVALVQRATLPDQQVYWGTLQKLLMQDPNAFATPATLIVGEVVAIGQQICAPMCCPKAK